MGKFIIGFIIGYIASFITLTILIASKEEEKFEDYMKNDKHYTDHK